jgi:hypothetical protein
MCLLRPHGCADATVAFSLPCPSVPAYPSRLGCSRSMTSGSMMGRAVARSMSTQVRLAKGGSAIACGGTLTAGDMAWPWSRAARAPGT